jgi:plasmid stability protein
MATLTIRNLPDDVHQALRRRAADNARSMEAEAREVLRRAVAPDAPSPADRAAALAALRRHGTEAKRRLPPGWSLVDELIAERRLGAALEAGVIDRAEHRAMLARLDRFEIAPEAAAAFALSRLAGAR